MACMKLIEWLDTEMSIHYIETYIENIRFRIKKRKTKTFFKTGHFQDTLRNFFETISTLTLQSSFWMSGKIMAPIPNQK